MRPSMIATPAAVLLSALALTGCGGSSAPKSFTIQFRSSALVHGALPALYTCDGRDISPPVEWGAVPSTTSELALFVLGLKPNRKTGRYAFSIEWAVAGINPALHKLAAGQLPPGAHIGHEVDGKLARYHVCPAKGKHVNYQFALYAVPAAVAIRAKFQGEAILSALANPLSQTRANAGGAFVASYTRG
jgi:phosphatidylethanolamine-binding protein (PEBP) family uncharacterized protein